PHVYADAGETATGGGVDCGDVDGAQLSDDSRIARSPDRQRMLGVQRLETPANETSEPECEKGPAETSWAHREESSAETRVPHREKDLTHQPDGFPHRRARHNRPKDALALRRAKQGGPRSPE
ncbi:MAG TPA: hypothetical protein VE970_12505, partial [Pseudolabrys sp.]|nr:hypothetical protein [Pseudolabrys sp.]